MKKSSSKKSKTANAAPVEVVGDDVLLTPAQATLQDMAAFVKQMYQLGASEVRVFGVCVTFTHDARPAQPAEPMDPAREYFAKVQSRAEAQQIEQRRRERQDRLQFGSAE